MDPETAYTATNARVYAVETIVPEPTATVVPENSQSSETGTSQAIGTILFRFLELRLNKHFIEASIIE